MSEAKARCDERVHDGGRWPSFHQCTRKAVCEHEGKHYCSVHSPAKIAERRSELRAKWEADLAKRRKEYATPLLYEALNRVLPIIEKEIDHGGGMFSDADLSTIKAALAAADGTKEAS